MSNIPTLPDRIDIAENQAEELQRQQDLPLDELAMIDEAEDIEGEEERDVDRLERIDAEQFEKGGP
jgi:hypothetical protein